MSQSVVVGGQTYTLPDVGERSWGQNVTDYMVAVATVLGGGGGAGGISLVTITTSPVNIASGTTYLVDTTAARQLNLPAPAANAFFAVRDISGLASTNNITINRFATELIDGVAANRILNTNNGYWIFACNGTNWFSLVNFPIRTDQIVSVTASRAIVANALGVLTPATTTAAEVDFLAGVTSSVQTQLNARAPLASPTFTGVVTSPQYQANASGSISSVSFGWTSSVNTGLYLQATGVLGIVAAGSERIRVLSTQVQIAGGNATTPAFSIPSAFGAAGNSGFYNEGSGIAVSRTGTQVMRFDSTLLFFAISEFSAVVRVSDGSATAPALTAINDTNTGLYWSGSDTLLVTTAGTLRFTFTATGELRSAGNGTAGAPIYTGSDSDTGIYFGTNTVFISTNGTEGVRLDSAGFLGLGITPTSRLHVGGSVAFPTISVSANTTLDATHYTVRVDANAAARTITLPAASGCTGRVYVIKKIDASANTVTIDGNAAETIDGATTLVLTTQWQSTMIQSDGANWFVLANA